jgi:hypothetical protein
MAKVHCSTLTHLEEFERVNIAARHLSRERRDVVQSLSRISVSGTSHSIPRRSAALDASVAGSWAHFRECQLKSIMRNLSSG